MKAGHYAHNISAEELEKLYIKDGLSSLKIANQIGVDAMTVRKYLKDFGIPIRPRSAYCRERNPYWKGGRSKHGDYIIIYDPDHPRARKCNSAQGKSYVYEHILVWEQVHKRPLPEGWLVHHINGIKSDNRPENLVALPNKKHYRVLAIKAQRIRALEVKVRLLEQALEQNQLVFRMSEN